MLDKVALRESEDSLGSLPTSTINLSDKMSLLGRDTSDKRLVDLVENPVAAAPKRKHPLTLKRTMSERTLDRGRPMNFLSLLTEKVHHERTNRIIIPPPSSTTHVETLPQPSPTHHQSLSPSLTPKVFSMDIHKLPPSPSSSSPTYNAGGPMGSNPFASAMSSNLSNCIKEDSVVTSTTKEEPALGDLSTLEGVERMLEAAKDNAQAALNKNETKRREAVWDLFQSECTFLYDHLMVLKNVSTMFQFTKHVQGDL